MQMHLYINIYFKKKQVNCYLNLIIYNNLFDMSNYGNVLIKCNNMICMLINY